MTVSGHPFSVKNVRLIKIISNKASYTEREKIEQELARKDELTVNLMNEIELLKEEKTEIQARTTETMSSLLRDLTDMGIAVNPEVSTPADISGQSKSKVVSLFSSHWDKEPGLNLVFSNGHYSQ